MTLCLVDLSEASGSRGTPADDIGKDSHYLWHLLEDNITATRRYHRSTAQIELLADLPTCVLEKGVHNSVPALIKSFKPSATSHQLVLKEVTTLLCLGKHPSLPVVLDLFHADLERVVFEWSSSHQLLREALSETPLDTVSATKMLGDLGSGLALLARENIVHLNVGVESVAVSKNRAEFILLDFAHGYVKKFSAWKAGHLNHQAPELLLGTESPEPVADVWSLGTLLILARTGKPLIKVGAGGFRDVIRILGSPDAVDVAGLCSLPSWKPAYHTNAVPASQWDAKIEPAFAAKLRSMLMLSPARCRFGGAIISDCCVCAELCLA